MKTAVFFVCFSGVFRTLCSSDPEEGTLRVVPNRSQFFLYESLSLSCGWRGSFGWRVMKNTSTRVNEVCSPFTDGMSYESQCILDALYPLDNGAYWCESAAGERSDAVNITVTRDSVILEAPALPVTEGDDVTLTCRVKTTSSSSLKADFYKDGLLVRRSSTANVTLRGVSKADGGLYNCSVSGAGESPVSWLTVRGAGKTPASEAPVMLTSILISHVVTGTPYVVSTIVLGLIWRQSRRAHQLVAEERKCDVIMEVD